MTATLVRCQHCDTLIEGEDEESPILMLAPPFGGKQAKLLVCPSCSRAEWYSASEKVFHVTITVHNGDTYIHVSRTADRLAVIGLLEQAKFMVFGCQSALLRTDACEGSLGVSFIPPPPAGDMYG